MRLSLSDVAGHVAARVSTGVYERRHRLRRSDEFGFLKAASSWPAGIAAGHHSVDGVIVRLVDVGEKTGAGRLPPQKPSGLDA